MAGEARSQQGGLQGQRVGPMMGDTLNGVVARRTGPSSVVSLRGWGTHAPADSRACTDVCVVNLHSCLGRLWRGFGSAVLRRDRPLRGSHGHLDIISVSPVFANASPRVHASVYGCFWNNFLLFSM